MDVSGMEPRKIVNTILKNRGIKNIDAFLEPMEEDLLPFDVLPNIKEASDIVINGVANKKRFGVLYDVDTDGIMSGTIMTRYLKDMGADVSYYINEGKIHGTTKGFVEFCTDIDVAIIVDSLDSVIDNYKKLYEMGKEIVVLDHHHIGDEPYEDYITLVSSYGTENDQLSGGGVVYKFINYIDSEMKTNFAEQYADLCCCALLGDMMDVSEKYMENRFLIKDGLDHLKNKTLKKIVGGFGFNSRAVSFSVAPKINACQRMNENKMAVEAFLTDNDQEIKKYISGFNGLKKKQDAIVSNVMKANKELLEEQKDDKIIFVMIDDQDSGLSGLIANKVLGEYQRPVFVLKEKNGYFSGSCRSINTEDMRQICEDSGFGYFLGHPNSFGVRSISKDDIQDFKNYLEECFVEYQYSTEESYDAEIDALELSDDLIKIVSKADNISGHGFESLKFKVNISDFVVGEMGKGNHLYLSPVQKDEVRLIIWNVSDKTKAFAQDAELFGDDLYCIGTLQSGYFGRKHYLQVITNEFKIK